MRSQITCRQARVDSSAEIVEARGAGHPDRLCEAFVRRLGFLIDSHGGRETWWDLSDTHLLGGQIRPAYGGGLFLRPPTLLVGGWVNDAPEAFVEQAVQQAAQDTLGFLPNLDIQLRLGAPPPRLLDLARAEQAIATAHALAHAPETPFEAMVHATLRRLDSLREKHPALGTATDVLAIRRGWRVDLTVSFATRCGDLPDLAAYHALEKAVLEAMHFMIDRAGLDTGSIILNPGGPDASLTITGSTLDHSGGGLDFDTRMTGIRVASRPNRSPAIGRDPRIHPGAGYAIAAEGIAREIASTIPGLELVTCILSGRKGDSMELPWLVEIQAKTESGTLGPEQEARIGEVLGKFGL